MKRNKTGGAGVLRSTRGAMSIETALLLPVLVLLIFGMIEFSLMLYNKQVITNASREGARAGIVQRIPRLSDQEIGSIVDNYCSQRLVSFGSTSSPTTAVDRTGNSFGADLTVNITYNYNFLVLSNLGFGPLQLVARTVMKME